MTNIANSESILWENLDRPWQDRLESAINSEKMPKCLIYPENETALGEILSFAHQENLKVLPCGQGTKLNWGGLVDQADIVVSTGKLNRIIDHAVGDLTLTIESGVTLKQIQDTLKPYNQFLPIDPSYPENATIGGIVATADTGSLRQRYGGIRDLILGLSFVRADGNIAKAGGRVVKNVAGYDLMKLFTGSYGTLGLISQINLRLYPFPPVSGTVVLTGNAENIKQACSILVNSALTPTCADILSASLVKKLDLGDNLGLIMRFQNIPESVQQQIEITQKIAQELGLKVTKFRDIDENNLWETLDSLNSSILCKVGILPSEIVTMVAKTSGLALINASSGLGKLYLETGEEIKKNRAFCEQNKGFLTILSAPKEIKTDFKNWGYTGNYVSMMSKIKEQFDPQNILSCGRHF
jgi:glycolate oxidase FAD binding subunit